MNNTVNQQLVEALPIGAAVFSGDAHMIEAVNDYMLNIWNKDFSVIGKDLHSAIPEIQDQPFFELLSNIYQTGEPFHDPNGMAMLVVEGVVQPVYFDYWLKPLKNNDGKIIGIVNTAINTTTQVKERQQREQVEERLRLAIESANLGTWFMNAETREFTPSARLKELFGYQANESMPYDAAINQVTDEYREKVVQAVNAAIEKGQGYDLEYPIIGFHDNKLRWVRATGKLYATEDNATPVFSGTMTDITEQKQNEQRKNDFISMVSHELKTPLTSLNGYVQVLRNSATKAGDAFAIGLLDRSYNQIGKMTTLINGFLNVSRFEAGKIHIDRKRFDMAVLVKEVESGIVPEATSHHIVFAPVEETWVNVDKDKIEQVINNLISNAIKYSPPYTTIQVACVTQDGYAYVSVRDEGLGIRAEDQAQLFDRFYRVEGQATKSIAGFGIGLYLCKEIIDRHDGKIGVKSIPGEGSTFWFTLPIC